MAMDEPVNTTDYTYDVSVCIANYNGIPYLEDCIESVLAQKTDLRIQLVIHDDCSTDSSVSWLKENYPAERYLHFKTIFSETNVGFCESNNRMVEQADGRYVLLLNNDAELADNAIETLYQYAERESWRGILSVAQYSHESRALLDLGCRLDPFCNPVPLQYEKPVPVAMVMGACLWLPKHKWQEYGGFPVWFGSIAEDMYLCLAAWYHGDGVRVLSDSCYYHRVGMSFGGGAVTKQGLSSTTNRRALSERNKMYVMTIFYPLALLCVLLPVHFILMLLEGIILSLVRLRPGILTKIYLKSFWELWKNRRSLSTARKQVQGARQKQGVSIMRLIEWFPYKLKLLFRYGLPRIK